MKAECTEFLERQKRLKCALSEAGIEFFVATTKENVFWLSGINGVAKVLRPYEQSWQVILAVGQDSWSIIAPVGESDLIVECPAAFRSWE